MRALDLFVDSLGEVEKKLDLQEGTRMFPRVKVMEVSRVRVRSRGTFWTWFSQPSGKDTRMGSKPVNRKISPEKYKA